MQLFSIITESLRVRCVRSALPFYAIFRTSCIVCHVARDTISRSSSCTFALSGFSAPRTFTSRCFFIARKIPRSFHAIHESPRWVIFPLYGQILKFTDITFLRCNAIASFFVYVHVKFVIVTIPIASVEFLLTNAHVWPSFDLILKFMSKFFKKQHGNSLLRNIMKIF